MEKLKAAGYAVLALTFGWLVATPEIRTLMTLLVVIALLFWCTHKKTGTATPKRACCRKLAGSGASRAYVARHEAGHYVLARRRGSSSVSAWLESDHQGWTRTGSDRSILDAAVISAGGTEATNAGRFFTESTTEGDAERLAAEVRAGKLSRSHVISLARRDVARYSGEIDAVAARLVRDGKV